MWLIYCVLNKLNGKTYIGQHKYKDNELLGNYFGSGKHLKCALKKYGKDNFKRLILKRNLRSNKEADYWEIAFIKAFRNHKMAEYNIQGGGQSNSPERRYNKKISSYWNSYCNYYESIYKHNRKRHHTDAVKLKIGKSVKYNRKNHPDWWKNLSVAVAKMNKDRLSKKCLCIETGIVYPSVAEASRHTSINKCIIANVCRGYRHYKTAGGYHWKYI